MTVVFALGQLTAARRLKSWVQFYSDAAAGEESVRAAILLSLRQECISRILARSAVPIRVLILPTLIAAICIVFFTSTGYFLMKDHFSLLSASPSSVTDGQPFAGIISSVLIIVVYLLVAPVYPAFIQERRKIVQGYRSGSRQLRIDSFTISGITSRMPSKRHYWHVTWRPFLVLNGLTAMGFIEGMVFGTPKGHFWYEGLSSGLVLLYSLVLFGLSITSLVIIFSTIAGSTGARAAWEHPFSTSPYKLRHRRSPVAARRRTRR